MLRELRLRADVGLRAVTRRSSGKARLSDGHLSRVERGLRPVSPAVLAAYERALGMRIDAYTLGELTPGGGPDDADRRAFQAMVATLASSHPAGELGGEGEQRLLHDAMYLRIPQQVTTSDVAHLEQAASTLRGLDLRHGGELTVQMAGQLLRWAAGLRAASMTAPVRHRWHTAVATLAMWGAWSAHDACQRPAARALAILALDAAACADEPDLRAHVLADIAAQHNHAGHPDDALRTLRLAGGDERTHPAIQTMLHGVRARAHAALGEPDRCHREIRLVEDAAAVVDPDAVPGWLGGWQPAHVEALCGHAHADLARATGDPSHLDRAHQALTTAAAHLTPVRPRAAALCLTHLARTHHKCGDPDQATTLADQARHLATDLRSTRLNRDLATLAPATGDEPPSDPAPPRERQRASNG
jgi:transcriptional regulator with XRE-family HTH domain